MSFLAKCKTVEPCPKHLHQHKRKQMHTQLVKRQLWESQLWCCLPLVPMCCDCLPSVGSSYGILQEMLSGLAWMCLHPYTKCHSLPGYGGNRAMPCTQLAQSWPRTTSRAQSCFLSKYSTAGPVAHGCLAVEQCACTTEPLEAAMC